MASAGNGPFYAAANIDAFQDWTKLLAKRADVNNPLQSLTNMVYMAAEGPGGEDSRELALQMQHELTRLSALVSRLLALPFDKSEQPG